MSKPRRRRQRGRLAPHGEQFEDRTLLAATTTLLTDIHTGTVSSSPSQFVESNGRMFFVANDGVSGSDLWVTDGTDAGTYRVKDIHPDPYASTYLDHLTDVNGRLFFSVDDGVSGEELWTSDGTDAGTYRVMDIRPGAESSRPYGFAVLNGRLYFGAGGANGWYELWTSDGTAAGTYRVQNVTPGTGNYNIGSLTSWNGRLYFSAEKQTLINSQWVRSGTELWVSDGTGGGTFLLKDIAPGTDSSYPRDFTPVNNRLYFSANDPTAGQELWATDGSAAGTYRVKDLLPGASSALVTDLIAMNGRLYFTAETPQTGRELWTSDGTEAGTFLVKDINPGTAGSWPSGFAVYQGKLYFPATDEAGQELWVSDGTTAGTHRVADIAPGSVHSNPSTLTVFNGKLYFSAGHGSADRELWTTDGTEAGTIRVKDIMPGTLSSNPWEMFVFQGWMYFSAGDPTGGSELWRSDGTVDGASMFKDINKLGQGWLNSRAFAILNGKAIFAATDTTSGMELWTTDGSQAGTKRIRDISPGLESSHPDEFAVLNGRLYFAATTAARGRELWTTDGTEAGTVLVKDVTPGPASSNVFQVKAAGGRLYFLIYVPNVGYELWSSDGTSTGTIRVQDAIPGTEENTPSGLTVAGGKLFFTVEDAVSGRELWVSDGTIAGTRLVRDLYPGEWGSYPRDLVNLNERLYFVANDPVGGTELWTSDGTAAGTFRVKDIRPGLDSSSIYNLTSARGRLYFAASDSLGSELWISDGTEAGTYRLKDLAPGATSSFPRQFTEMNGRVYFSAEDGVNTGTLWVTDGTAAGTVPVHRLSGGSSQFEAYGLKAIDGVLYFSAQDSSGRELWRSDGTEAGTYRLADLNPGPDGSDPVVLGKVNGSILFSAANSIVGREMFVLREPEANLKLSSIAFLDGDGNPTTQFVAGQRIAIRATWTTNALTRLQSYVVRFHVDGVEVDSVVLTGAEGANRPYEWIASGWYATPGEHTATVTIDPLNSVIESNEGDNSLELRFTASVPSLPQKFSAPLGGVPNQDWVVFSSHDLDPRPGYAVDFQNSSHVFDQYQAWDFILPNFAKMDSGVPVLAVADGVVAAVWDSEFDRQTAPAGQPWNFIRIDHGGGWSTVYGHLAMKSATVVPGQAVRRGDILALTGSSGSSGAANLYFSVLFNNAPVETNLYPDAFWENPLPNAVDQPLQILDAGITFANPFQTPQERPLDKFVFSRTTDSAALMWFWFTPSRLPANSSYEVRWIRPNGQVAAAFPYVQAEEMRSGVHAWSLASSVWRQQVGVWSVQLVVGGQVVHTSYATVTDTAAPPLLRAFHIGQPISPGRSTPVEVNGTLTLSLQNLGGTAAAISQIELPEGFVLVSSTPTGIAARSEVELVIQTAAGPQDVRWGDVIIWSNDPVNPIYSFSVRGSSTGIVPLGTPFIIAPPNAIVDFPDGQETVLLPGAVVSDPGGPASAAGYVLSAKIVSRKFAGDVIVIKENATITVTGSNVFRNGNLVATLQSGPQGTFQATFSETSALSDVQQVLRMLAIEAGGRSSNAGKRIVQFNLTDQTGLRSSSVYQSVLVPLFGVPPREILLANRMLLHGQPSGTFIGQLLAIDPDGGTHTFELVNGPGSTHNALFSVSSGGLSSAVSLSGTGTASIRVRATDSAGLFFEKILQIHVVNVPPAIQSVVRNPNVPISTSEAEFLATFTEPVSGVTAADFRVVGENGASVSTTIEVMHLGGPAYQVRVSGISGAGLIRLQLADDGSIRDAGDLPYFGPVSFESPSSLTTGAKPRSVIVADFNGDGRLDLATANEESNTVSLFLGLGGGAFHAPFTSSVGMAPGSLVAADVTGDGKLDLVVSNRGSSNLSLLAGNGNGTFQAQQFLSISTLPEPDGLVAADLNDDGRVDLAFVAGGVIGVLHGNGNGTFQATQIHSLGGTLKDLVAADLNRDGRLDLIVAQSGRNRAASVLIAQPFGGYRLGVLGSATGSTAIAVGDLNRDGIPDVVAADEASSDLAVFYGFGNGQFQQAIKHQGGTLVETIQVVDFDNDGFQDVVLGARNEGIVRILYGTSNQLSVTSQIVPIGGAVSGVAFGDFNADGRMDLVAANWTQGVLNVFRRQPTDLGTIAVVEVVSNSPPVVSSAEFQISESAAAGMLVGRLTATDSNPDQVVAYSILDGNLDGAFAIDPTTGDITVLAASTLDHFARPVYELTVQATDNGWSPLSSTTTVTIRVGNAAPRVTDIRLVGTGGTITQSTAEFVVQFSEAVSGVGPDSFELVKSGTVNAGPLLTVIEESGSHYRVIVSSISGTGSLGLNFRRDGVVDRSGTPLDPPTGVLAGPIVNVALPNSVAPTIGGFDGSVTYKEDAPPVVIDSNATVTDPDSPTFGGGALTVSLIANGTVDDHLSIRHQGVLANQIGVQGQDVLYSGATMGTWSGGADGTPLLVTFHANASRAAVQALIRNLVFANDSQAPSTAPRTIQLQLNDGTSPVAVTSKSIAVSGTNDPPVVVLSEIIATYIEDQAPAMIDAGAIVTDPDLLDFQTGRLTVTLVGNTENGDRLSIRHQGAAAGEVGLSGTTVTFGGVSVASVSGGTSASVPLQIVFNKNATQETVQAVLRNVVFFTVSDAPSTLQRTLSVMLTDGDGGTSATATQKLNVKASNDGPVIGAFDTTVTHTEKGAATILDTNATITDIDSADFAGGKMTVSLIANGEATDLLSIRHQGTGAGQIGINGAALTYGGIAIGTFTGGTSLSKPLVITFNAAATPAIAQAVLRNLQYQTVSNAPSDLPKTVQVVVTDGDGGTSASVTKTITVKAVNDPPAIGAFDTTVTHTEKGAATILDTNATITDIDSADFAGGKMTVSLIANGEAADRLSIRHQGIGAGQIGVDGAALTYGGVAIGTFTGGTSLSKPLVITFNAAATKAIVQVVLRNLQYQTVSNAPSDLARTVQVVVTDGDGGTSASVTKTITVKAVNDPPVISAFDGEVSFLGGASPVLLNSNATVTDPDSADFAGGKMTVSLIANGEATDRLTILHQGSDAGQVGVIGSSITFGGVEVGTFQGGAALNKPLVILFNASANSAAVQAVLRRIAFSSVSSSPASGVRVVQVVLTDGDGGASAAPSFP